MRGGGEVTQWIPGGFIEELFRANCRTLISRSNAMQAQPPFGRTEFVSHAVESERLDSGEAMLAEAAAMQEDRERRRMEFRSSLVRARAAQARVESREIAKQALRHLSAGFMERQPARMIADLAGAR